MKTLSKRSDCGSSQDIVLTLYIVGTLNLPTVVFTSPNHQQQPPSPRNPILTASMFELQMIKSRRD